MRKRADDGANQRKIIMPYTHECYCTYSTPTKENKQDLIQKKGLGQSPRGPGGLPLASWRPSARVVAECSKCCDEGTDHKLISRVTSVHNIKAIWPNTSETAQTKNIVYKEVLLD